jgi:hypothetical protein
MKCNRQGDGAHPMLWTVVSTTVLNDIQAEGFSTFFNASLLSGESIWFVGYCFVDDTNMIQTSRTHQSMEQEFKSEMQWALNTGTKKN